MEEHDRPTPLVPRFYDVELNAPATCDFMSFHVNPPVRIRCKMGGIERRRSCVAAASAQSDTFRVAPTEDSGEVCARFSRPKNVHVSLDDLGNRTGLRALAGKS